MEELGSVGVGVGVGVGVRASRGGLGGWEGSKEKGGRLLDEWISTSSVVAGAEGEAGSYFQRERGRELPVLEEKDRDTGSETGRGRDRDRDRDKDFDRDTRNQGDRGRDKEGSEGEEEGEEGMIHSPMSERGNPPAFERNIFDISDEMG